MSKKWYGSIDNRIDEGHNFTGRDIQEGDDITMYYWSDRHCYYVTKVIDQKHIMVKQYQICADRSKPGGMGHQNWLYFKTSKEMHKYLNDCQIEDVNGNIMYTDLDTIVEDEPQEWVFRYGKWRQLSRWTKSIYNRVKEEFGWVRESFTEKELNDLNNGKEVLKYYPLQSISFGVREYYYDWEF